MDTGTRRQIIEMLKRDGPQSAGAMSSQLGISPMAVRQHLYTLADEGLVEATSTPSGVGRPSKSWHLTEAADAFFPQGYAELTAGILSSVREAFGDDGVDRIVAVRTQAQIAEYKARMDGAETLEDKLRILAEIRTGEGYMAGVEKRDGGYLFTENHCPICVAARSCTGLCAAERNLFEAALGDGVSVERTEHILAGARRCAYMVSSRRRGTG